MIIINKEDYPDIFTENEEMPSEDIRLFNQELSSDISGKEKTFFVKMQEKEQGEFAAEADIILSENDNDDEIYIIRYYYTEYRIGRGKVDDRSDVEIYTINLSEALTADLFPLLNKHITTLEWLKKNNFKGINYFGNYEF